MAGAFLYQDRIADAVSVTALNAVADSMPVSNLRDPQPRVRMRFSVSSASLLVDFGTDTALDAVALISTNLTSAATIRWRSGPLNSAGTNLDFTGSFYSTGTVSADTAPAYNGNVVLVAASTQTYRGLRLDITDTSLSYLDIGRVIAGPLWRLTRSHAYGIAEGRLILDRRERNALTGAEFVVPAIANPRAATFALPVMTTAEAIGEHRAMVAALGAARDALWIPDTALSRAELNARCIWGAVAEPGQVAGTRRLAHVVHSRAFSIIERL